MGKSVPKNFVCFYEYPGVSLMFTSLHQNEDFISIIELRNSKSGKLLYSVNGQKLIKVTKGNLVQKVVGHVLDASDFDRVRIMYINRKEGAQPDWNF